METSATLGRIDFTVGQKVLHWLMGIVIMLDLFVAQKFGNPMELADRLESRVDHASLGTIITVLFVLRIFMRLKYGAAPLPAEMPEWQQQLAKWAHVLLYILIASLLLTGIATAVNAANPIAIFGAWDITIGQSNEETFDFIRQFHEWVTNLIIGLIAFHIVAALYHGVVKRDGTMSRMLKFWQSAKA